MSHHTAVLHNCLPHHRYLYLPHRLLIAQVQEVVSGEWTCVADSTTVTTGYLPGHDPVVMGGFSRRGDAPDKPGSSHESNVDAGYQPCGRRMNDFFFIAFHFAA